MKNKCIVIFLSGVVTTAAYGFFSDWTKMPMSMMNNMSQPQAQQVPIVCDCRCN